MDYLSDYLDRHREDFEEDLRELLRIPSVSADSRHREDVRRAAEWVRQRLAASGLSAELIEGAGHPLVYAESKPIPGAPVALVYGHYDVQPPDPLGEWVTPPFEPTVRDGNIYARGATDDKGQMLTHVHSVRGWLETQGKLPLQVKFIIEGEEEVGGHVLEQYLLFHAERLACDCVVISDTSQFAPDQPAITYGLRGIIYCELRLRGPKQDLHSGVFGGAVSNPATGLAKMLAALVNDEGRIQVPHFYDDVAPLSDREREQFAALPFDEVRFQSQIGVSQLLGEAGYSTIERRWARPSLDVNGIWGGYQGEGQKTVLPASAGAKFSFRLVPNQEPDKIVPAIREYLQSLLPPGLAMEFEVAHTSPGFVVPLESPFMQAAANAVEAGFGKRPVFIREGGSIPIVTQLAQRLGAEVLLLGWGRDDDNTHSPNEKFSLADYHRGIRASAALWQELANVTR